jgi:hypothetical protein
VGLLDPVAPPYDALEWKDKPFPERCRTACQAWALEGYGSPPAALLLYGVKVAAYFAAWCFFCSFTPGLGPQT